jgi:hypothetical protein
MIVFFFFFRNFFLDFDGWGLVSAIEQNFNPNRQDIFRKEKSGKSQYTLFYFLIFSFIFSFIFFAGYLRLMSSNYTEKIFDKQRPVFFSGADADAPWTDTDAATRFYLNFPFYPFRTLNPRDTVILRPSKSSSPSSLSFNSGMDFDYASCLLPAHTQLSITMKRRRELLNYMVPMQLVPTMGDNSDRMTQDERQAALTFTVTQPPAVGAAAGAPAVRITYRITSVQVTLDDMVLLVSRKKKKF